MGHWAISMFEHYGSGALFASMLLGIIGLPVPDEFLLVSAGAMAISAHMRLDSIILAAWAV